TRQFLRTGIHEPCWRPGTWVFQAAWPSFACVSRAQITSERETQAILVDDGENIILRHDQIFFAVQRHFAAGIGSEQNAIAFAHLKIGPLAIVKKLAIAEAEHLSLLWLFLGSVG